MATNTMRRPRPGTSSRLHIGLLLATTLACILASAHAEAAPEPEAEPQQTYVIPFSGAIYITVPAQGSPAVPAQCPANAPVSCSSIGQPDWCCPSGKHCGWSDSQVGCCPDGSTCSGWAGAGAGSYNNGAGYTSSYWQPTQTYCPAGGGGYGNGGAGLCASPTPVETVYVQTSYYNGGGAAGGYYGGATTTVYAGNSGQYTQGAGAGAGQAQGQYCSTLYAQGPGLPTVRAGQCGQILVLAANEAQATVGVCWALLMAAAGAQVLWRRR